MLFGGFQGIILKPYGTITEPHSEQIFFPSSWSMVATWTGSHFPNRSMVHDCMKSALNCGRGMLWASISSILYLIPTKMSGKHTS